MVRALAICGLAIFPATLAAGQITASKKETARAKVLEQRRKQYPDLANLVDLAQSVPPEFSADVLLRIAASGRMRDAEWKKELLEQAFQNASLAEQPVRQTIGSGTDFNLINVSLSRAEKISRGFDQKLDRLSLRSRVLREMLNVDRGKALEMFQMIVLPELHARTCSDALVDQVSDYYEALTQIINSGFNAEERRHGLHVELVNYRIHGMRSPVEVGAMAKTLSSLKLNQAELSLVAGGYAAALERIPLDFRSFSSILPATDHEVHRFVETLRAKGISTNTLIASYRQYLIRNFTGSRCAYNEKEDSLLTTVVDSFNKSFALDTDPTLAPLVAGQIQPDKVEGEARLDPLFDDAELKRGWEQFQDLVLGKGHGDVMHSDALPDAKKDNAEWRSAFDDFLRQADELKPETGEPEYRYFYRKATALTVLLTASPPGAARDKVMRQLVVFLAGSPFQQESPMEWYAQASETAIAANELGAAEYQKLLGEMERSGNAVLALDAMAERVVPREP